MAAYKPIELPLDLRPIGIDFTLERADQLDDYAFLKSKVFVQPAGDSHLVKAVRPADGKLEFVADQGPVMPSNMTLRGVTYNVVGPAGAGTYGVTAKVKEADTPFRFALKEQKIQDDEHFVTCVREAVINYVLWLSSEVANVGIVPKFHFLFQKEEGGDEYIYYLMEELARTGDKVLAEIPVTHVEEQANKVAEMFSQMLDVLWRFHKLFSYTHGDMKADNFMYDAAGNMRMIDFGFSRIEMRNCATGDMHVIQTSGYNTNSNEGKDLIQLAFFLYIFRLSYERAVAFLPGTPRNNLKAFLERLMNIPGVCDLAQGVTCGAIVVDSWAKIYEVVNTHRSSNSAFEPTRNEGRRLFPGPPALFNGANPPAPVVCGVAPAVPIHAAVLQGIRRFAQNYGPQVVVVATAAAGLAAAYLYSSFMGGGARHHNHGGLVIHNGNRARNSVMARKTRNARNARNIRNSRNIRNGRSGRSTKRNTRSQMNQAAKIPSSYTMEETLPYMSVEHTYDSIRFSDSLRNVSDAEKKDLLTKALWVPLREKSIHSTCMAHLAEGRFQSLQDVIENNMYTEEKLLRKIGPAKLVKPPALLMDAYFRETDRALAFRLLQALLFLKFDETRTEEDKGRTDGKSPMEQFIDRYFESPPDVRALILPSEFYLTEII